MARTAVRVSALILRDDKILLFHRFRDGKEYWVIPGGGVEEGETIEEALQRELWEETSLHLISCRHAFDYSYVLREGDRISHFSFAKHKENRSWETVQRNKRAPNLINIY